MIDYFEKARAGRVTALSLHTNGHVMFFPEEYSDGVSERQSARASVQVSKPMFLRSSAFEAGALIEPDVAANTAEEVFVLSEDHIVDEVLRQAA